MTVYFISIDAEGLPYTPSLHMMGPKDPLYNELREIMTKTANTIIQSINPGPEDQVILADSHGAMVNLKPLEIPSNTSLARGFPRPLAMISGASNADAAILAGYHTSPRLGGVLAHTYAGRIVHCITLPGDDDCHGDEYLLNTYALGSLEVPVIAVAGDALLYQRVKKHTPWAGFAPLKQPLSATADLTPPWEEIERSIANAVGRGIEALRNGEARPLQPPEPWIKVELKRPWHADIASLYPCVERLDGYTILLECDSFLENFKLFEGIIIASYALEKG